jgi:hypothetical protein
MASLPDFLSLALQGEKSPSRYQDNQPSKWFLFGARFVLGSVAFDPKYGFFNQT